MSLLLKNDFVKLGLIVAGAILFFIVLNRFNVISNEGYDSAVAAAATLPSTVPVSGITSPIGVAPLSSQVMPASSPPLAPVQATPPATVALAAPPLVAPQPIDDGAVTNIPTTFQQSECYPKDTLTAADLLPSDKYSKWNAVNPTGQGDLADKNFLTAGYQAGIDTVGNSLKNQSYDLRGDAAPNPQVAVGPFLQSSLTPDLMRKKFEIGGNC